MIIWLASYPKSGNTWLRSIISSLLYTDSGQFKIELLKKIPQFPVERNFQEFTNNFTDIHEIKKYWILAQSKINLDRKIKFLKTHHINVKLNEFNFTNQENSCATIYMVRDPRNLVNSISNHFSKTHEESKYFLMSPRALGTKREKNSNIGHVVTLLGNWGEHYRFWKQGSKNFLLIRYEDLINNPERELDRLVFFLKTFTTIIINEKKKEKIIKTTSFESLKKIETEGLFKENVINHLTNKKVNFFNQGPKNKWKNFLDKKIKDELEVKFRNEMKELNYI
tara:strand:- start:157 stop:999 length:843 start_codon:yes stop_codon:yes gene_type:complete